MLTVIKENKEFIKELLIALIIAIVVLQFVKPVIVSGESMVPTLQDHDLLLLSRQAYLLEEPKTGDIIVCDTSEERLIKRIIAVPGDKVEIINGAVMVNGMVLDEPYIKEAGISGNYPELIIPEGYYYVLGDNREISKDSRYEVVGNVSKEKIVGKAVFRFYPFSALGKVN
ncbi:signal peptidase I [Aminipila sp.]|uniref:signal peptidase I n=1 Tax=Aminipila sp. TaxID=2060095 RepID=UPI0028985288|nr:signal peptidase I [Aminipila sp.]